MKIPATCPPLIARLFPLLAGISPLQAAPAKVSFELCEDGGFASKTIPSPAINDAAANAAFKVIAGRQDPNGASPAAFHDGKVPRGEDEPGANFFFSGGGRVVVDLGKPTEIAAIASYSWHPGSRAAQNYEVFAADGSAKDFNPEPGDGVRPAEAGWTPIARVDTSASKPGQHAVSITPGSGRSFGKFQHLLFVMDKNPKAQGFGDTFYSEIDIVDADGPKLERVPIPKRIVEVFTSKDKKFRYTLDVSEAPDLQEWCGKNLIPVMEDWYPKIIGMLPVDGVTPSREITFTLKDTSSMPGQLQGVPAYASGNSVVFNAKFMRDQQTGEAIGAGVHEIVHVVQFGGGRENGGRNRGRGGRPPSWVTEGVADYIRWFLYEPQSKGAEITKRNVGRAKYDDSYRTTANFFDWVIKNHEKDLMRKLNVATHDGYNEQLWKDWTGKSLQELGDDWKKANLERLGMKE
jgi:hypothetical protein